MDRVMAIKESIASMQMEGFCFTDEELTIFEKLAKGEISYDDVKKIATDKLKLWQIESPESFAKES